MLFQDFKLPHKSNHFWHLFHTTEKGISYYIHTSGVVGVKYKSGKEKLLKGFIAKNHLYVKIEGKAVKVKNLVAREIFKEYRWGIDSVVLRDGNPRNCDCYNMEMHTPQELGSITGGLSNRSMPVIVEGKEYSSIRQAAKDQFVSRQTISDKISGKYKSSILDGKKVKKINKPLTKF